VDATELPEEEQEEEKPRNKGKDNRNEPVDCLDLLASEDGKSTGLESNAGGSIKPESHDIDLSDERDLL